MSEVSAASHWQYFACTTMFYSYGAFAIEEGACDWFLDDGIVEKCARENLYVVWS